MELTYNITEEDYIQFNLFHIRNSQTAVRTLNIQRYLSPVIFIIFSFIFPKLFDGSLWLSLAIFGIMSILWIVYYPKYYYSHILRHVKKMLKEGKNHGILGEHHMYFADEGIIDKTVTGETKVSWSGIEEFKEDDHNLYLYNSSVSAYILPKRELENLEGVKQEIKTRLR